MIPTQWREDFITSYVERYLPRQGTTAAPILLRRFCPMLARQSSPSLQDPVGRVTEVGLLPDTRPVDGIGRSIRPSPSPTQGTRPDRH